LLALVKDRAEPGLTLRDVERPEPGVNDVLIRVSLTGVCGTDLHIHAWDDWAKRAIRPPLVVGHEFVGEVVAVGSNVTDFFPGERVSGEGHVVCGRCRNCLAGRRHLCPNTQGVGVDRAGAFAEYVVLPMTNVWHHWPIVSSETAAIFDPLGNAVHAALSFDVLGEDVLICGAGPIGCMAAAVVRHAGARHVVATDPHPSRRALAERLGATRTLDPREDGALEAVQRELGMTEGFDVGLEMSGAGSAMRDLTEQLCHGGRIAMLGIPPQDMIADWRRIVFNMLTIKGIYGREMYETWYKMSAMISSGLDVSPVITHRLPFRDFEAGFEAMQSGEAGKVILDWRDAGG
jgi:threonine 3-dehydrogenase